MSFRKNMVFETESPNIRLLWLLVVENHITEEMKNWVLNVSNVLNVV